MADIPEYKNKVKIEPAPVAEASPALAQSSKAWNIVGQLGNQFAQNQANEISRQSGAELGRTKPGLPLLPVIGESGVEFVKAYKTQEYSTAITKGATYLDRLSFDTLKNPTPMNMRLYDEESQKYIEQLTTELTPENARAVKEQLQTAYLNSRYKIEAQLEQRSATEDEGRFKATYKMFSEKIVEYIANNNQTEADKEVLRADEYIDDPYQMPGLGLEARRALKKSLRELAEDNKVSADIQRRIKKGENVTKIIKSYADATPTVENLRKAQVAAETLQRYASQTSAHDNLLISQATTQMIKQGGLSTADLAVLKSQILPNRFADFEVQLTKFMEGQKSKTDSADFMEAYANNSAMLNTLGGAALDKGFQVIMEREAAKAGRPLNIAEEAQVAQKYDVSIPSLNAKLSGGINSKNAAMARDFSQLYTALARNNPNVVAGVDNTSALKAVAIANDIQAGSSPEDAWKAANDNFNHLTPQEIADSKSAFTQLLSSKGIKGANDQMNFVLKTMGFSKKNQNVPPGLALDFMQTAENNYVQGRNWDASIDVAKRTIAARYQETNHNGFMEVQKLPPTLYLPEPEVRALEVQYLQALSNAQKQSRNNLYYELDKTFTPTGSGVVEIAPGIAKDVTNPYTGTRTRINADGTKTVNKGIFLFKTDKFTDFVGQNPVPSWSIMFLEDGKQIPALVYNPEDFSNARFIIPLEVLQQKNAVDKELMQHKENITNIIRKMANMVAQQ